MTTKTIAGNNKILSRWTSIHYIPGCSVALPQLSSSFLEMLRTYCFWAFTTFPTPPTDSLPLHFNQCSCVCVCCARGVGWEAYWNPAPPPPPRGGGGGGGPAGVGGVNVCVCVFFESVFGGGVYLTPPPPPPPPFGWVCHHILKWLVKYLCVWVCPWWRVEIDHFFRWLFGHKTWPNYLIIFIWPKGWWLVSIGSTKKDKFKRTKAKTQITKLIPI
jgi:hypothetical protein